MKQIGFKDCQKIIEENQKKLPVDAIKIARELGIEGFSVGGLGGSVAGLIAKAIN